MGYHRHNSLLRRYRALVLVFTFVGYMSYHLSRKPISVVKTELYNCTHGGNDTFLLGGKGGDGDDGKNCTSWIGKYKLVQLDLGTLHQKYMEQCQMWLDLAICHTTIY